MTIDLDQSERGRTWRDSAANTSSEELDVVSAVLSQARIPFFILSETLHIEEANAAMMGCVVSRGSVVGAALDNVFSAATVKQMKRLAREAGETREPITERHVLWAPVRGAPAMARVNLWPLGSVGGAMRLLVTASVAQASGPAMKRVAQAVAFIHDNIGHRLEASYLAEQAGVSSSQLQRDFQDVLGQSPKHYVTTIRFERALEHLMAGEPVASVAHACGYSDQSAFTRRFRAAKGMPPTAYFRRINTASGPASAAQAKGNAALSQ